MAKVKTRDDATKYTALTDEYLAFGSKSLARVGYINAGTNTWANKKVKKNGFIKL